MHKKRFVSPYYHNLYIKRKPICLLGQVSVMLVPNECSLLTYLFLKIVPKRFPNIVWRIGLKITDLGYVRVVFPNFGQPALTSSFKDCALCRCCRHATKIINHHSKLQNWQSIHNCSKTIFHLKNSYFVNNKVRPGVRS